MANLKYSRQREAIKEYLSSTDSHPTADTVYMHVKKEFPSISLGTVYRNLNLLADIGEAVKISTPDGGDRFDSHTVPHCHFYCRCCGQVTDVPLDTHYMEEIDEFMARNFDGIIESHSTIFYGVCKNCKEKGGKEK